MLSLIGGLRSFAVCCLALTALVGSVREASACQPPPGGWFPSGVAPAPANGVVLLSYACYADCETIPAAEHLVLKDAADAPVPGSVVFSQVRGLELVIAFRPEPGAITAAGVYTAELDELPTLAGILVGPAVTWNDALTLTDEIFESDYPRGETVCCDGPIDSCGNAPCFRTEVDRRTNVSVGWYEPASIEFYQYVFRIGRDAIDPGAPWSWDHGDARFELGEAEASACYVLELKRLVDDSVQTFASRCVERPESFTPGVHPTPDEDIAGVLNACDDPPDGYEKAWCEARQDICETSPDEQWCANFAALCAMIGGGGAAGAPSVGGAPGNGGAPANGGVPTNGGTAGTRGGTGGRGGSSGAQGGDAGTPDGEAGEAGDTSEGKRVLTKGCGCTVPGTGSGEPASFVLALALVALRLRRAGLRWNR